MLIRTVRETDAAAVASLAVQLGYPMTAEQGRGRIRSILADSGLRGVCGGGRRR